MINIHDDGNGIEQENWENIFKPFVKFNSQGYGMGLAIAERIVNWHKGEITVSQSILLKGACFKVSFQPVNFCQ